MRFELILNFSSNRNNLRNSGILMKKYVFFTSIFFRQIVTFGFRTLITEHFDEKLPDIQFFLFFNK